MGWEKIEPEYSKEISIMKRFIYPYKYSDIQANQTDEKARRLWISKLKEMKALLEDVAKKQKASQQEKTKRIIDDINFAMEEMETLAYWKFPEDEQLLGKIIKADLVLLGNLDSLANAAKSLHSQTGTPEEKNFPAKFENFRKLLSSSRVIFLERAEIIKLKR